MELSVGTQGGEWKLQVRAFSPTWLPLPGNEECWPQAVQLDNQIVPVVSRGGIPAINLTPGLHSVSGDFVWKQQPVKIAIPSAIGILDLTLDGQSVSLPNRDTSGWLWLRRSQASAEEKDQLSLPSHTLPPCRCAPVRAPLHSHFQFIFPADGSCCESCR